MGSQLGRNMDARVHLSSTYRYDDLLELETDSKYYTK